MAVYLGVDTRFTIVVNINKYELSNVTNAFLPLPAIGRSDETRLFQRGDTLIAILSSHISTFLHTAGTEDSPIRLSWNYEHLLKKMFPILPRYPAYILTAHRFFPIQGILK